MATVNVMTADELFDAAIEEGKRLIKFIDEERKRIGPNGPPSSLMDNALDGLWDIFDFLKDQRDKQRKEELENIQGGFQ